MTASAFSLYAVIGYPLKHTLSPPMHRAALRHMRKEGYYFALEIPPDTFDACMKGLSYLPLRGCNVTVPYKERIIPFLDRVSDEARIIGAVNTVVIGEKCEGYNTDAYGFMRSFREDLKCDPRGKSILIMGAGGAARACIYALAKEGCTSIVVADSDEKKARALINHFKPFFPKVRLVVTKADQEHYQLFLSYVDVVINATPVGLKKTDPLLIPASCFPEKKLYVYDLIYNPAETKLMQVARKKGCVVANGLGMLLYQGARACELWNKQSAPVHVMKKALLAGLRAHGRKKK